MLRLVAAVVIEALGLDPVAIPLLHGGAPAFQLDNVLAAVGAAWALGLSQELIRTGLRRLQQTDNFFRVVERFIQHDQNARAVLIDNCTCTGKGMRCVTRRL